MSLSYFSFLTSYPYFSSWYNKVINKNFAIVLIQRDWESNLQLSRFHFPDAVFLVQCNMHGEK